MAERDQNRQQLIDERDRRSLPDQIMLPDGTKCDVVRVVRGIVKLDMHVHDGDGTLQKQRKKVKLSELQDIRRQAGDRGSGAGVYRAAAMPTARESEK